MTLSDMLAHSFVPFNDSIPWLLPLSGDIESIIQSVASVLSILHHPDLYPSVSFVFCHNH